MAEKYIIDGDKLTSLADAVRSKTGETSLMTVDTMTQKLNALKIGNEAASEGLKQAVRNAYQSTTFLTIPESVGITNIRENFMRENHTVNQVAIPEGVESIGHHAFYVANNLANVKLPTTLKTIGKSAFYGTSMTSFSLPENVETVGDYAFAGQTAGNVKIKDTKLRTIGAYAFSRDSGLDRCKTIDGLPETLESIGMGAFMYCQFNIDEVSLPNLKTLGEKAFVGPYLGKLTIKNFYMPALDVLYSTTFAADNEDIQKIKIDELSAGAKEVVFGTHQYFTNVSKLILTYEGVASVSGSYGLGSSVLVFVPDDFYDAYKASSGWAKYASQIHKMTELNPSSVVISAPSEYNIHSGGKSFTVSTVFDNELHKVGRKKMVATLTAEGNATITQDGTVTLTDSARAGDVVTVKATTEGGLTASASVSIVDIEKSYSVNLNGQWEDSKTTAQTGEIIYQSGNTQDNGTSVATITFQGYNTFKMMVKTDGESNYDYLEVGALDKAATRDDSEHLFNGKGKASATQFYEVDIPVADNTQVHSVQVIYSKDNDGASGTDKGYFYVLNN